MGMYFVKNWYCKPLKDDAIYGAEWAGTSDPSWVRTDAAVGFADPNPYYSGMSTTPSSPFDNIMPWSGMRRVTDANAGELVEIPKFYYKWTRDGVKMKLQISTSQFDGSHVSPAHADRGDGVGERDYVYIGRYHCCTNNYKSTSGVKPKGSITRGTARTNIHNLGTDIWQIDYALWWTVNMLYLVEFANWNSQAQIGMGCGDGSSTANSGASDTMPYHTGTMQNSRAAYGVGIQYRYIEDWWANIYDWIDGIYFSNRSAYCIKNPAYFGESGGTYVGSRTSNNGYITKWSTPSATGFEYALVPSASGGSDTTYVCDYIYYGTGTVILCSGGNTGHLYQYGAFFYYTSFNTSVSDAGIGCRLMVLPSSRLAA